MINSISQPNREIKEGTFATLNVSKDQTSADIDIWDIIGDDWVGTTAKQITEQVKNLPKSVTLINVEISSPGGEIWSAIDMYHALKNHPAHVVTRVNSIAASAAVMPLMAGDERIIGPYADVMIHKPMTGIFGTANDFAEVMERLNKDQQKIVDIYLDNGVSVGREEVNKLMNDTTWMDASRAVELGFGTEVSDDLKVAACAFNLDGLNGCPTRHKNVASAIAKRQKEKAARDDGNSHKVAKAIVAGKNERDAQSDVSGKILQLIEKMEIV